MYGLFVGFGFEELNTDIVREVWSNSSRASLKSVSIPDALAVLLQPIKDPSVPLIVENLSGISVIVDGYILMRNVAPSAPQIAHCRAFAAQVGEYNLSKALGEVVAGSYNLVVLDERTGHYSMISDPYGSITLYYANVENRCLFATNPLALARLDGVDRTLDFTAQASWALIGYTIGRRYFIKGIQIFPAARILCWDCISRTSSFLPTPLDPYTMLPGHKITTEEICATFVKACARLEKMRTPTAHLQSAGMDSRLIMASWPKDNIPTSYTYGKPGSVEVDVAREVAEISSSSFIHSAPNGDDVAEVADDIFESNGLIVYPDRYLIAQLMARDGWKRVIDGFAGDVLIGGTYYNSIKPPYKRNIWKRFTIKFRDHDITALNFDRIAEKVYTDICEVHDPEIFQGFASSEWIKKIKHARVDILEDIYKELLRLRPDNNSLALLYRNFLMANRLPHSISQQGVMCRQFVKVAYPFTNDFEFIQLILKVKPEVVADRRFYIKLYKRHHPRYAAVPWGPSLLPLYRSFFFHKVSKKLLKRGLNVPGLTGNTKGLLLSWNNWQRWLHESATLRDVTAQGMHIAGIADTNINRTMLMIEKGTKDGNGKLMHLSAIGRWIKLAK
jgi:asparagine synthetase B (glutamine-hydrolysing)